MDTLPVEIHYLILLELPNDVDICNAAAVCHIWAAIIRDDLFIYEWARRETGRNDYHNKARAISEAVFQKINKKIFNIDQLKIINDPKSEACCELVDHGILTLAPFMRLKWLGLLLVCRGPNYKASTWIVYAMKGNDGHTVEKFVKLYHQHIQWNDVYALNFISPKLFIELPALWSEIQRSRLVCNRHLEISGDILAKWVTECDGPNQRDTMIENCRTYQRHWREIT